MNVGNGLKVHAYRVRRRARIFLLDALHAHIYYSGRDGEPKYRPRARLRRTVPPPRVAAPTLRADPRICRYMLQLAAMPNVNISKLDHSRFRKLDAPLPDGVEDPVANWKRPVDE